MGAWHAFENIYDHKGALGHEIIFATDVELIDASLIAWTKSSLRKVRGYGVEQGGLIRHPCRLPV
jgi:hypothetical protein